MNNFAVGIVTEDPAMTSNIGQELKFNPVTVHHQFQEKIAWLKDWESFKGILLKIHFTNSNFNSVEGSGIMVGPGVALCAKHVFEDHLHDIMIGSVGTMCTAITNNGISIWRISKIALVPNSDLVILGLTYATALPQDNTFNQAIISTRLPKIGENLLIAGFRASDVEFSKSENQKILVSGNVLACNGEITERYPAGRDAVMLPWPSLEVNCPTLGGMSGGPAFDSNGLLIGLLTSSFDHGPSYVSLLWPALAAQFEGGWPTSFFSTKRTLIDMTPSLCSIDNPTAIKIIKDQEKGGELIQYNVWE